MKFYYLSQLQKIDITITTLMFCIFFGFLRPLVLSQDINTRNIIAHSTDAHYKKKRVPVYYTTYFPIRLPKSTIKINI